MAKCSFPWTRARAGVLGSTLLLGLLLVAGNAGAQVPVGDYCVSGFGSNEGSNTDGWVGILSPAPVVNFINLTAGLSTTLVDPWDCAIDPTTGDIILVDEGPNGSGTDGSLHRISVSGGAVSAHVVLHAGPPLVNPHGVAVGQDGTIYVGDSGPQVNNNATDGAVYSFPPFPAVTGLARLDTPGVLQDASDVDIDPKPFIGAVTSPGVNLIVQDSRNGQLRRLPITGGTVVNLPAPMGGNDWEAMEVGPYGNYFSVRDGNDLHRYDRLQASNQQVQNGGALSDPLGITVDYFTGDLVVADRDNGVINVPPNAYLGGGPAATTVMGIGGGALPERPAGVGFSPPPASTLPSANFGMPTRRAPIPGAGITQHGAGTSPANGDVEFRQDFFIEVTDVSSPLMIRIFDANIRDGYDGPAGGGFGSTTIFSLTDPLGATVTSVTIGANARVDLDQRIATLNSGNTLSIRGAGIDLSTRSPGLYQLTARVTTSDDFSTWGLWVEDFNSYSYTTIYGALNNFTGPNPQLTPLDSANLFPYFDRGCEYTGSNWDLDFPSRAASLTVNTRLGTSVGLTGSTNNQHLENAISPLSPNIAEDYGLHSTASVLSAVYTENNIVTMRYPDFQGWVNGGGTGVPIPVPPGNAAANPTPSLQASPVPAYPTPGPAATRNSFLRQYLPRYDEAPGPLGALATPYAPHLQHNAVLLSATSPADTPTLGTTDYYVVIVQLQNPDPVNALGAGTLTIPVPAPTQYVENGFATVRPAFAFGFTGAVLTPPCSPGPCSGNLNLSFSGLAPGATGSVNYFVAVTPTVAGQTLYLTEGPPMKGGGATPVANPAPFAAGGTYATFTPAWQSGAFPRAESLGPICDLSVVEGSVVPVAVDLASFDATPGDGQVLLTWETASEFENLGFDVYRQLDGEAEPTRLTEALLLGRGTTDLSARYGYLDETAPNGVTAHYWIEDIEFNGTATRHGPATATPEAGAVDPSWNPADYASAQSTSGSGASGSEEPGSAEVAETAADASGSGTGSGSGGTAAATGAGDAPPSPPSAATADVASLAEAAGSPGVKIGARGVGAVAVSAEALFAAGLPTDTDPRSLGLLRQGREVAIEIDGEADGRLDPGDTLRFWNDGYEDRYTDVDVFFLVEGAGSGLRMADENAAPLGGGLQDAAEARGLREDQSLYLPGVLNDEGDNYVGAYVFDSPVVSVVATPAARSEDAVLHVRLRGGTSYAGVEDDHHFSVRVAGQEWIDARFDGSELFEASAVLPGALLGGDSVAVEIVPRFDSGAPFDLVYVDAIEIVHTRSLEMRPEDAGRLVFVADVSADTVVGGLTDPDAATVWDVTDPDEPLALTGLARDASSVVFSALGSHRYAVVESPAAPASLVENLPSQWADAPAGGGADWLAIAHESLSDGLAPLVALREGQGLATAVVDVEDVYDEFAGGRFTPEAIRAFVAHARAHWDPAPRYLLLVGDATYDYRDHLGGSAENRVPTMLLDTTFVEAASDGWLAGEGDSSLPAVAVGRLPVADADALETVVDKLVAYESAGPGQDWQRRMMLVADDGGGLGIPSEAVLFEDTLDAFTGRAPTGFDVRRLALSDLPEAGQGAAANAWIRDTLSDGAGLAVYVGHGGARMWADEIVFGSDDFDDLANPSWPMFVVLNCLNAFFDAPNEESLAEVALRSEGRGAVAFVSSTTVSPLAGQTAFAEALAESLLSRGERRVGDAFHAALVETASHEDGQDVVRSFVLMGDPASVLGLPAVPVADAGPDRDGKTDSLLRLDGRNSFAPDGAPLDYAWQVVAGPELVELVDADRPQPGFRASLPGLYRVELRVHDGAHGSAPDHVEILVEPRPVAFGCGGGDPTVPKTARFGPELLYLLATIWLARPMVRRRP